MENQHRKISGYRELSQKEIDLMNGVKALGPQLEALISKINLHLTEQMNNTVVQDMIPVVTNQEEFDRLKSAEPHRWVNIAKADFQTGLMALTRAIAQPTFF